MNDHERANAEHDRRYYRLLRRARWGGYVRAYWWLVVLVVVALLLLWIVWLGVVWGMV